MYTSYKLNFLFTWDIWRQVLRYFSAQILTKCRWFVVPESFCEMLILTVLLQIVVTTAASELPAQAAELTAGQSAYDSDARPAAPADSRPSVKQPLDLRIVNCRGKRISFGILIDSLMDKNFICIGEQHDSEVDHLVQLQIIKALFARDESLGVGMEIFQRPFQAAIDRYFSGEIDEIAFLKVSEYGPRWGYDWTLYRPKIEFCRRNNIPLAALNAPKELTTRISKVGFEQLTDAERQQLGPVDFQVKAHRNHWYELLGQMHGLRASTSEQKEHSYQVMTVWDDYMAQSAAQFKAKHKLQRMVILAGSGHIDGGFGIPFRVARYSKEPAATIRILDDNDQNSGKSLPVDYEIRVIR